MYSVIDLETTGFSPARGDRILELGVVKVQEDGQIIDKYSTLINPERDISNYNIHGVKPDLVKNAPKFHEVKDYLKSFINGTTLVAHNAPFDFMFLQNELIDQAIELKGICTIKLSRIIDSSTPSRNLENLCRYYDIEINDAHEALSDALATSKLFSFLKKEYLSLFGNQSFQKQMVNPLSLQVKKSSSLKRVEYKRNDAFERTQREKNRIQVFIERLPTDSLSRDEKCLQYLDTLNEVLSDRIISNQELNMLEEVTEEYNLTKKDIIELHKQYLIEVIKAYFLDSSISEFEKNDLNELTKLLGLKSEDLNHLIKEVSQKAIPDVQESKNNVEGNLICFTGILRSKINGVEVDRLKAQSIAQQHGMIVKKNVSKKLDYLVVADPHTQSGKAKKAKKYGIKILAEPEYWRLIGVNVE